MMSPRSIRRMLQNVDTRCERPRLLRIDDLDVAHCAAVEHRDEVTLDRRRGAQGRQRFRRETDRQPISISEHLALTFEGDTLRDDKRMRRNVFTGAHVDCASRVAAPSAVSSFAGQLLTSFSCNSATTVALTGQRDWRGGDRRCLRRGDHLRESAPRPSQYRPQHRRISGDCRFRCHEGCETSGDEAGRHADKRPRRRRLLRRQLARFGIARRCLRCSYERCRRDVCGSAPSSSAAMFDRESCAASPMGTVTVSAFSVGGPALSATRLLASSAVSVGASRRCFGISRSRGEAWPGAGGGDDALVIAAGSDISVVVLSSPT